MMQAGNRPGRNRALECCKLAASFFVVFIHAPFPGKLGEMVTCLARFAVPFFFAVSGYFSFGADENRIAGRIERIFRLNLGATALYALWGCFKTKVLYWGSVAEYVSHALRGENLLEWLVFGINPFAGHLWYLTAALVCYGLLWCYVRWKKTDYRVLYAVSGVLYLGLVVMGEILPRLGAAAPYPWYRNVWFMGIPMFALGLWLREHEAALAGGKFTWLVPAGAVLGLLEWGLLGAGDVQIGSVPVVAGLLSLAHGEKDVPWKIAGRFGGWSTTVYVVHLLVIEIYELLGLPEGYGKPLAVLVTAVGAAVVWDCAATVGKKTDNKLRKKE